VEIESVVVPTVVVVAVWLAVVLLEVAAEIAHEHSFASSVEVPGEILVDNAILGHSNDAPYIHLSIRKVLFHNKDGTPL